MKEKDLISKLNNAKKISPDKPWLASNRELFLHQIANSGADSLGIFESFYINFKSLAKALSQPAFATLVFLFVLLSSSIFGHKLFSQAKPNDSLYIARVISEKAKLNTVLDTKARDKMAVKFATSHAKEISQVLANPEFNTEENKAQVDRLSESFVKEIEKVENKMASLAQRESDKNNSADKSKTNISISSETSLAQEASVVSATSSEGETTSEESVLIASEGDYKSEKGLQLYTRNSDEPKSSTQEDNNIKASSSVKLELEANVSSSNEEIAGALLQEVMGKNQIDAAIISEIKVLFQAKKYSEVILKINQISESEIVK